MRSFFAKVALEKGRLSEEFFRRTKKKRRKKQAVGEISRDMEV